MNFDYVSILTDSVKTLWKHKSIWALILAPILIAFLPFIVVFLPIFGLANLDPNTLDTDTFPTLFLIGFVTVFVLSALIGLLARTVSNASFSLGLIRAERGEGSTNFMVLIRESIPYFWRILGVMLVIGLTMGLVFGLIFLLSFVLIAVTIGMASICLQPFYILLAPLMYLVMGMQDAAQIAIIDKNLSVGDALKHAFQVVREHVWKYVIVSLIIYFGTMILSTLLIFPFMIPMFAAVPIMESGNFSDSQNTIIVAGFLMCIFYPVMILFSSFVAALMKTALGLTYLRLTSTRQETENQVIFSEP